MLLIIGANGKIGTALVQLCQQSRLRYRLGVRDIEKAKRSFGKTVDLVLFDYNLPHSYGPACQGIKKVFFIAPTNDAPDQVSHLLKEMIHQGIEQIVFSSGRTTGDIVGSPLNEVENLVRSSGIPYTILRPGWFMQNFLNWIGLTILQERKFYLPAGDSASAFIDVKDIAEVASKILTQDESNNQTLDLTSSEALTHDQVAEKLSKLLGVKITYQSLTPSAYIDKMHSLGWDKTSAEKMSDLYEIVRSGKEAMVSNDIELILGRPGRSFDEFLQDHRREFRERYLVQN